MVRQSARGAAEAEIFTATRRRPRPAGRPDDGSKAGASSASATLLTTATDPTRATAGGESGRLPSVARLVLLPFISPQPALTWTLSANSGLVLSVDRLRTASGTPPSSLPTLL